MRPFLFGERALHRFVAVSIYPALLAGEEQKKENNNNELR